METVTGKIIDNIISNNYFDYFYIIQFEKDNGEIIEILSKNAYPLNSIQTFNIRNNGRNQYIMYKKTINFLPQKIIMLIISACIVCGSFVLANNRIHITNKPLFKGYLLCGGIVCILLAVGELTLFKKRLKEINGENYTESITADVLKLYSLHSGNGHIYFANIKYKYKDVYHRGFKQVPGGFMTLPSSGDSIKVNVYQENGLIKDEYNVKTDVWANAMVIVFGVLALCLCAVMPGGVF